MATKDPEAHPCLFSTPTSMIGTHGEDGAPDAMTMASGQAHVDK